MRETGRELAGSWLVADRKRKQIIQWRDWRCDNSQAAAIILISHHTLTTPHHASSLLTLSGPQRMIEQVSQSARPQ